MIRIPYFVRLSRQVIAHFFGGIVHTTDNFFRCVSSRSEGISVMLKTCPDCNGDGVVDKDTDNERQCLTCGGRGFVPDDDDDHEEVIRSAGHGHAR